MLLDSRLRLPSEAHFILAGARPELSYSDSRSSTWVRPTKRKACVQHDKEMLQEPILKRHIRSYYKPTTLQTFARSSFILYKVFFHNSKYNQPYHIYILIAHRWQKITRLLPLKVELSIYSILNYIRFMVYFLDKDVISMQQVFSFNTYNLM
jgi:hypothetical protein